MANNITNMAYAQWLEQALRELTALKVHGIVIAATTENGDTYTNYYNVSMADKLVLSGLINQDATLDMLAVNGIIQLDNEDDCADCDEENGDGEAEE